MLRFCANLSFLFSELPFFGRFAAAAAQGFRGVEYMFPYAYDIDRIAGELRANGLEQVLFNLPPGDWDAGERGLAGLPGREAEFRESLAQAISFARQLECRRLNCLAGLRLEGVSEAAQLDCLQENLRFATRACAHAGIQLLIEPINSRIDMPGYLIDTPDKALQQCFQLSEAGLSNRPGLQFDVYHAQVMTGDALRTLCGCETHVAHVQIADYPGRHEPGSGEIDWHGIFTKLVEMDYVGWVGCEYRPQNGTLSGLRWRENWPETASAFQRDRA